MIPNILWLLLFNFYSALSLADSHQIPQTPENYSQIPNDPNLEKQWYVQPETSLTLKPETWLTVELV